MARRSSTDWRRKTRASKTSNGPTTRGNGSLDRKAERFEVGLAHRLADAARHVRQQLAQRDPARTVGTVDRLFGAEHAQVVRERTLEGRVQRQRDRLRRRGPGGHAAPERARRRRHGHAGPSAPPRDARRQSGAARAQPVPVFRPHPAGGVWAASRCSCIGNDKESLVTRCGPSVRRKDDRTSWLRAQAQALPVRLSRRALAGA